jgi:hypothetical protein
VEKPSEGNKANRNLRSRIGFQPTEQIKGGELVPISRSASTIFSRLQQRGVTLWLANRGAVGSDLEHRLTA